MAYLYPGVYVEEVPGGARPITGVSTSEAAFFGHVHGGTSAPVFATSWTELQTKLEQATPKPSHLLSAAFGFFQNGGTRLHVVPLPAKQSTVTAQDIAKLESYDTVSLVAAPGFTDAESHEALLSDCELRGDRFAVLDMEDNAAAPADLARLASDGGSCPRGSDRGVGAVYTPWVRAIDPVTRSPAPCPPSGHICGLYAETDAVRGVWKAPANAGLRGALDLSRRYSDADQGILNQKGINVIRSFPDGIRVWGARTQGDQMGEWRYVPVRRLTTMISQSLKLGTRWVVFEPNDLNLWKTLRRDISAFLHGLWRDGALAGATPEEAFFVKIDTETTTQADINQGKVIAIIGIAPVKPAEFVIIRIGQSTEASTAEEG